MKGSNKFLRIGLIIIAIMQLLHIYQIHLPDFIEGLGYGIGISLELVGINAVNHDISKFSNFKMKLLKRIL